MLFLIFLFFYAIYSILILKWLYKILNQDLSFFYGITPESLPEKYQPFARFDRHQWNHLEIYFCAIFLLPIRLTLTMIFIIIYYLIIVLCGLIWPNYNKQTRIQRTIIQFGGNLFSRLILYCAGFYWISKNRGYIKDFLPGYYAKNIIKKAPFIVSNHYSWLDIFYFISSRHFPSFLSKKDVENYPMVGKIAKGLQSVFVSRDNRLNKNEIIERIEERAERCRKDNNVPSLLIFPEGTTTNGKFLISFKKGAFFTIDPVKIICLKYQERRFGLSYDGIGDLYCMLFVFLQLKNVLSVTEFENFDPEYLGLKKEKEGDWEIYMSKVKEVMRGCLGAKNSEAGFSDKRNYYKEIRDKMKEKKEKKKEKQF